MDEIGRVLDQVLENQAKIKETMKNMIINMSKMKSQFEKKQSTNDDMPQMLLVLGNNNKLEENQKKYKRASNEFNSILVHSKTVVHNLSNDVEHLKRFC